nr:alpha/beta hydrolase [uncultured Undibacterium sp.]
MRNLKLVLITTLVLVLNGCANLENNQISQRKDEPVPVPTVSPVLPPTATPKPSPVPSPPELELEDNYAIIKTYFATERNLTNKNSPADKFGNNDSEISYGFCEISIPMGHVIGEVETPSLLRLEFREDPVKHMVILKTEVEQKDEYFSRLSEEIRKNKSRSAFVFIHGYNVSFSDAAKRTAQMAHDLGFQGAPVFYSWPSQGKPLLYTFDEQMVERARFNFRAFLEDFIKRSDADNIYLIAHSMGNRLLVDALSSEIFNNSILRKKIKEIVLAAPDIDAKVFKTDIAPKMLSIGAPITLYASSNDRALAASKKIHKHPRAGQAKPTVVAMAGIETIDASNIDTDFLGHSYLVNTRSVLNDLYDIITYSKRANQRFSLKERVKGSERYWYFSQ